MESSVDEPDSEGKAQGEPEQEKFASSPMANNPFQINV